MGTVLIIYFAGFIASYYTGRYRDKKDGMWSWQQLRFNIYISLFSWIGFALIVITWIIQPQETESEPPKWL